MQFAVLPFRWREGKFEVMMVTSRETARWVTPKGWPMAGLSPERAAAREAFEEAGLLGVVSSRPVGGFTYWKILSGGKRLLCTVLVYPLLVTEELAKWPEQRQRRRAWFTPDEAVERVDDALLGDIIRRCEADPTLTDIIARAVRARGPAKRKKRAPKVKTKAKAKPKAKPKARLKSKVKVKAKAKGKPKPDAKPGIGTEQKAKTKVKPGAKKAKARAKAAPGPAEAKAKPGKPKAGKKRAARPKPAKRKPKAKKRAARQG
ncbi:NUDIX hydrolase [Alsobacter sp. SYSU M60028]|uniref:NUDIX hydrolase n=1 Tax=Alsobacter ponti TaxID=2962936 RepID=A0ABT1LDV6_9HYPH|nr:NUDIX hydrolase [Alsobacter ponti]MCP8939609.1 NUDIX hydrolase [Alsobacter ponti]